MQRSHSVRVLMALAAAFAFTAAVAGHAEHRAAARNRPVMTGRPSTAFALVPGQMAVSAVTARYFRDSTAGQKLNQNCSVEIKDSDGNQVLGATVTVQMSGDWIATLTGQTVNQRPPGTDIYAHFGRLINGTCGKKGLDTFTCTVVNVSHPSLTYVPSENTATASTDDCFQ